MSIDTLLGGQGADFDRAFRITPPTNDNEPYRCRISTGFTGVPGRPIGSYVLACALRCMLHYAGPQYPDVQALHANFYSSPPAGSVVDVQLVERRKGKMLYFMEAHVTLPRPGKPAEPVISAQGVFGVFPKGKNQLLHKRFKAPPPMRPASECRNVWEAIIGPTYKRPPYEPGDVDRDVAVAMLADPDTIKWAQSAPKDIDPMDRSTGLVWMFHPDGRLPDSISLCFFADQPPPSNYIALNRDRPKKGLPVLMPSTVSLSIHFHAKPTTSKIINFCNSGCVTLDDTFGKNDNEIILWDESGRLVASSRQIVHLVSMEKPGGKSGEERLFGSSRM